MEKDTGQLKESIKLSKMSKGYNWEIRIFPKVEFLLPTDILRLQQLDDEMRGIWGVEEK